jgi:hypothetical protein
MSVDVWLEKKSWPEFIYGSLKILCKFLALLQFDTVIL